VKQCVAEPFGQATQKALNGVQIVLRRPIILSGFMSPLHHSEKSRVYWSVVLSPAVILGVLLFLFATAAFVIHIIRDSEAFKLLQVMRRPELRT
jgi:hypothetical protein